MLNIFSILYRKQKFVTDINYCPIYICHRALNLVPLCLEKRKQIVILVWQRSGTSAIVFVEEHRQLIGSQRKHLIKMDVCTFKGVSNVIHDVIFGERLGTTRVVHCMWELV